MPKIIYVDGNEREMTQEEIDELQNMQQPIDETINTEEFLDIITKGE